VGQQFWARGYYVSTVGRDEASIREYIQKQQEEDKRLDQLSMFHEEPPPQGGARFANRFERFTLFKPPALPGYMTDLSSHLNPREAVEP
jgi:hypothetical protein